MAQQLFFDFYQNSSSSKGSFARANQFFLEEFISNSANFSAQQNLKNFLSQSNFFSANFSTIILSGPESCGKSLLLKKLSKEFSAKLLKSLSQITKEELESESLPSFSSNWLYEFQPNCHFLLDEASEIREDELLFLLNFAAEKQSFLTLALPENWQPILPDLASRLKNLPCATILAADLEFLLQILTQKLASRQIILEQKVLEIISVKYNRTYKSFANLAKRIEFFCFETGKKFSPAIAQEFFETRSV